MAVAQCIVSHYNLHSFFKVNSHFLCQTKGILGSSKVNRFVISPKNFLSSLAMQIALCCCSIVTSASQSSGVISHLRPPCIPPCDKYQRSQRNAQEHHRLPKRDHFSSSTRSSARRASSHHLGIKRTATSSSRASSISARNRSLSASRRSTSCQRSSSVVFSAFNKLRSRSISSANRPTKPTTS